MIQEFAILGLDAFGYKVATELYSLGHPVIAVDRDPAKIYTIRNSVTYAVEADLSHHEVLQAIGIKEVDTVLVSLGSDFQTSLLLTYALKELGVKFLAVKAEGARRQHILSLAGADVVIQPENDLAVQTANFMHYARVVDYMELEGGQDVVALRPPRSWINRSVQSLSCENNYGVHILALLNQPRQGHWQPIHDRSTLIQTHHVLLLMGERKNLVVLQQVD